MQQCGGVLLQDLTPIPFVRKAPFLKFLREKNYELLWVIVGEKLLIGALSGGRTFPGRLEMGGAFRLRASGKIEAPACPPVAEAVVSCVRIVRFGSPRAGGVNRNRTLADCLKVQSYFYITVWKVSTIP